MARGKSQDAGPTLIDVAAEARVSVITASRALRDQGPMSEATRDRVLRAAQTVGYRRNPIAASLVSASSNLVGVVVPSLANMVFVDVLAGLTRTLSPNGFRPLIGVTDYDPAEEARLVDSFLSWRPAALVLTGTDHAPQTRAQLTPATRVIEVMEIEGPVQDIAIGFSHAEAGRVSARHLLARGRRRIGYLGHDLGRDPRAARRHAAFRATLAEAGHPLTAELILPGPSTVALGREGLARLLMHDLDAVYFSNDDMAIGGLFHCMAAGIDVPGRLAVMGFNGLDIGQALPRPLTTLQTPRAEIGLAAGQAILALAAGQPVAARQEIACTLIPGATA